MIEDSNIGGKNPISVKDAASRLQRAVASLSASLTPISNRLKELEADTVGQTRLEEDRQKLSSELDTALAEAKAAKQAQSEAENHAAELKSREAEFTELAEETMKEMDMVISQVKTALNKA